MSALGVVGIDPGQLARPAGAADEARAFYLHLVPGFATSPTDPLHLVALAKDLKKSLRR